MTFREILDWWAYYELEPWGPLRTELQLAQIATITANVHRDRRRRSRPYRLTDFQVPLHAMVQEPGSGVPHADVLLAKVRAINAALGGVDRLGERNGDGR